MLIEKSGLPFPRGTTYSQAAGDGTGAMITLNDTVGRNLEGRTFQVPDTIHGTDYFITLRIVKNDSGGILAVSRLLHSFSTASPGDWGCRVNAVPGAGEVGKPMDDAYYYGTEDTSTLAVNTSIADDDLFYVIEEGPCLVESAAGADIAAADQGVALASDAAGRLVPIAAGDYSVGVMLSSPVNATAAATAQLIYVRAGIVMDAP